MYGIIRIKEISSSEVTPTEIHNKRLFEDYNIELPKNINTDLIHDNEYEFWPLNKEYRSKLEEHYDKLEFGEESSFEPIKSLKEAIAIRLNETGVKVRKNSVIGIEYILSVNDPKFFTECYDDKTFMLRAMKHVIGKRHQLNDIVSFDLHRDESNIHAHIVALPIKNKEVKWKNRNGEGVKIENRLCARDFYGGSISERKQKLRNLQDDYFEYCSSYNRYCGGDKFYRGTYVEHELKEYVKGTSKELGDLRNQFYDLQMMMENHQIDEKKFLEQKKEMEKKLKEKQQEALKKTNELELKKKKHDERMRSGGWKKGIKFDRGSDLEM